MNFSGVGGSPLQSIEARVRGLEHALTESLTCQLPSRDTHQRRYRSGSRRRPRTRPFRGNTRQEVQSTLCSNGAFVNVLKAKACALCQNQTDRPNQGQVSGRDGTPLGLAWAAPAGAASQRLVLQGLPVRLEQEVRRCARLACRLPPHGSFPSHLVQTPLLNNARPRNSRTVDVRRNTVLKTAVVTGRYCLTKRPGLSAESLKARNAREAARRPASVNAQSSEYTQLHEE